MTEFLKPVRPFRAWIQSLQKHLLSQGVRKSIDDLLALSSDNDPFYVDGGETKLAQGRWFQSVWRLLEIGTDGIIHLRQIFYALMHHVGFKKPDGTPFLHTDPDWKRLLQWSVYARVQGLVDVAQFNDRRNPDPILPDWTHDANEQEPSLQLPETPTFTVPEIFVSRGQLDYDGDPEVVGYDDSDWTDRTHYLEIWVEKSTMNDVLIPLCEELGIGLVPAIGTQSITSAVSFLRRCDKLHRPGRILYISDYDDKGFEMPVSVARHLEFWRPQIAPDCEVALQPIALTVEQIHRFKLPRHGKGIVELDALEGLRPGELARLVRAAVRPYIDHTLSDRLVSAREEAEGIVSELWTDRMADLQKQLNILRAEVRKISNAYVPKVEALQARMDRDLRPYQKRMAKLQRKFADAIENFDVKNIPKRPSPDVNPNETDWLFDPRRDYLTQLAFYKQRKSAQINPSNARPHRLAARDRKTNGASR